MRLPIRFYRSSIFASIISLLGSALFLSGVCAAVSEDVVAGIILSVVGVACLFWANFMNARAVFRKWIKRHEKQGIVDNKKGAVNEGEYLFV